jgi:hypothetical protein
VDDSDGELPVKIKCTLKTNNLMDIEIVSAEGKPPIILQNIHYQKSNSDRGIRLRFSENQSTSNVVLEGDQIFVFSNVRTYVVGTKSR